MNSDGSLRRGFGGRGPSVEDWHGHGENVAVRGAVIADR